MNKTRTKSETFGVFTLCIYFHLHTDWFYLFFPFFVLVAGETSATAEYGETSGTQKKPK